VCQRWGDCPLPYLSSGRNEEFEKLSTHFKSFDNLLTKPCLLPKFWMWGRKIPNRVLSPGEDCPSHGTLKNSELVAGAVKQIHIIYI
jgi:hypothetical protein